MAARLKDREPFPGWQVVALLLVVAGLLAAWLWTALVRARRRPPGTDTHDAPGPP